MGNQENKAQKPRGTGDVHVAIVPHLPGQFSLVKGPPPPGCVGDARLSYFMCYGW